jgi:hypothetical protein
MLLINMYHRGKILNTSTAVGYDIYAAYIFSTDDTINFHNLRRQIHTGLELLPNQFNITISARMKTAKSSLSGFL